MKSAIKLAATIHDPEGRIAEQFKEYAPRLKELYSDFVISFTPSTKKELTKEAEKLGINTILPEVDEIGIVFFAPLFYFEIGNVHYIDLDRALHWIQFYPEELQSAINFIEQSDFDYILFERTERAHQSHHKALYETEFETNQTVSRLLGFAEYHDFFSGSFAISEKGRIVLAQLGVQKGWEFLTRYPKTVLQNGLNLGFLKCEGLEWETPDRYANEVASFGGIAKWREAFSTPAEWDRRKKIKAELLRGIG